MREGTPGLEPLPAVSTIPYYAALERTRRTTTRSPLLPAMFLSDASKRFGRSLDLDVTLGCMTDLCVPALGQACVIHLFSEGQAGGRVAALKHIDASREYRLKRFAETAFGGILGWQPLVGGGGSRHAVVLSQLETAELIGAGRPAHVVQSALGLKTAVVVPISDDQSFLGIALLLTDRTGYYTPRQVGIVQELVDRFAIALVAANTYQSCKAALDATQQSLATTIHDLLSALTYLKGTTQWLRGVEGRALDPSLGTDFGARLSAIESAVNRMASTISGLQAATQQSPRSFHIPANDRTDLAAVVLRVVRLEQLIAKRHQIRTTGEPGAVVGTWDANQLERMLANLIGNAVKYSPGGSSIEVQLSREIDEEGCWAVVSVIDHGIGIPTREMPFVLEPYYRASNVGAVPGTGLGLASVEHAVKKCGGRLHVDSREGVGTCVTVRLPLPVSSQ